jgi:rhamnopyranosyl-N-acetylglucosaminyl-diphospho-decaprenol beta-1,3/1,4-galactofuranosyltransferase
MRKNKKEKIAAVVVTYNRKELLQECLNSLLKQTKLPDSIIIMDNNSTDGTEEMLKKEYLKNPIFDYVNLKENLGGAGGFHYGIKRAYEKGFDWFWCMDDDGFTDKDQLKKLYLNTKKSKLKISGPLVLVKEDHSKLAFSFASCKTESDAKKIAKNGIIFNQLNPFNGTLISKNVLHKIGNIKKEMFIWGDEVEYLLRAKKNNLRIGIAISAKHYHPISKTKKERFFFKKLSVRIKSKEMNHIFFRNLGYINKNYFSNMYNILFIMKYLLYFVSVKNFRGAGNFLKYYFMGYLNRYN